MVFESSTTIVTPSKAFSAAVPATGWIFSLVPTTTRRSNGKRVG